MVMRKVTDRYGYFAGWTIINPGDRRTQQFNVGYNIFYRQNFTNWCGSPDFFLRNQMYDQEKVIYIINSKLTDLKRKKEFKLWEKELKKKTI